MKNFQIKSFCKINLFLRVLNKLNNGHHNINSLITFCEPYDLISIRETNHLYDKISFSGKFKEGIDEKFNTITKVLYLIRKMGFFEKQSFRINIQKNIPHGSGLGGGSSNAASLLNFLNTKKHLKLNKNTINQIASKIGFDVPINLEKKNTFLGGRRNKIYRFNQKLKLNILIVFPNIICSTKTIYKKNKKFTLQPVRFNLYLNNKKKLINFIKKENNDLERVVFKLYPKIKKIIDFIKVQKGCCFSRITGSGSACIGIFSDEKSIIFAQKLIKLKFPKYWSAVSKTM